MFAFRFSGRRLLTATKKSASCGLQTATTSVSRQLAQQDLKWTCVNAVRTLVTNSNDTNEWKTRLARKERTVREIVREMELYNKIIRLIHRSEKDAKDEDGAEDGNVVDIDWDWYRVLALEENIVRKINGLHCKWSDVDVELAPIPHVFEKIKDSSKLVHRPSEHQSWDWVLSRMKTNMAQINSKVVMDDEDDEDKDSEDPYEVVRDIVDKLQQIGERLDDFYEEIEDVSTEDEENEEDGDEEDYDQVGEEYLDVSGLVDDIDGLQEDIVELMEELRELQQVTDNRVDYSDIYSALEQVDDILYEVKEAYNENLPVECTSIDLPDLELVKSAARLLKITL